MSSDGTVTRWFRQLEAGNHEAARQLWQRRSTELMEFAKSAAVFEHNHATRNAASSSETISKNVGKKGPGVFQIPGLIKIVRQNVSAKPARKGVPDPFHPGQLRDYPAKPASVKVKVRALKNLKSMV
jgi:hypothetical protein